MAKRKKKTGRKLSWGRWEDRTQECLDIKADEDDPRSKLIPDGFINAWINKDYAVQLVLDEQCGRHRLSVRRHSGRGRITWEALQRIKLELVGDIWAAEVYPPKDDTVKDCNMRHLWLVDPGVGWRRDAPKKLDLSA